ncbi:unnamed protein product [Prunus armeniaca]
MKEPAAAGTIILKMKSTKPVAPQMLGFSPMAALIPSEPMPVAVNGRSPKVSARTSLAMRLKEMEHRKGSTTSATRTRQLMKKITASPAIFITIAIPQSMEPNVLG